MSRGRVEWRPEGAHSCIHQLFEAQVARTPHHVAVVSGEESVSYRELNDQANAIARELLLAGAAPEQIVGIFAERSIGTVATILGTLKSGAAYIPLDPDYPHDRLAFMLSDSGSSLALVPPGFDRPRSGVPAEVLVLPDRTRDVAVANPKSGVEPGNLAYVIYTSGSSGVPKGAANEHRGVANLIQFTRHQMEIGARDRVLQFASMSFDASIWEIFVALACGATLVLGDREELMPGPSLHRLLRRHGVTIVLLSPSVLRVLPSDGLDALRIVVAGTEKLTADIVQKWAPGRRFFNGYGPTECSIYTTILEIDEIRNDAPSIGRPIPNTKVYILDEHLKPVPPGASGELCIGGVSVGRGYVNRDELTLEKFVTISLEGRGTERVYRSGDRARERSDGELDYLGRMDFQVKIRGFRVELGEIEAVLEQHEDVSSAVVLAGEDARGQAELWAYHIRSPGATYTDGDLRNYLKAKLPAYMVPASFTEIDRWPLTRNRKIDRAALPHPDREHLRERSESGDEAMTSDEAEIARLCSDLLGIERLGPTDDIFDLGFHSLLVAQLAWQLQRRFDVEVGYADIFAAPTVRDLAHLVHTTAGVARSGATQIKAAKCDEDIPLSFTQERVWFLESLNPDHRAYSFQSVLTMKGRLDIGALENSLNEIVSRHEILRTSFPLRNGRPIQRVHDFEAMKLSVDSLDDFAGEDRASEVQRRIDEEVKKKFQLDRLPLIQWTLYRVDEDEHVLLHREHHLLHDGWSYGLFLEELWALYDAFASGQRPTLPPPPIQYRDFATWQREMLDSGAYTSQLDYWLEKLEDAPPPVTLPGDRPRGPVPTFDGAQIRVELDATLCSRLATAARSEGVTTFMWLFALFQTFLHRYTGSEDICVGSGFASRGLPELEKLFGMVINTVVIRGDFSGQPRFRDVARRFRQTIIEASDNQDVPFDEVVRMLNPERAPGQSVLFNTFFDAYLRPYPSRSRDALEITRLDGINNGQVKFDLVVLVVPRDSLDAPSENDADPYLRSATLLWEYNSHLFDRSTAERMLGHFLNLMESALAEPASPVSELPMQGPEERHRLLLDWNDTAADYPRAASLASLFEIQVARDAEAVAVVCGEQALTYGELNRRANAVAHRLQDSGVGPDVLVGLGVDRGIEMVVGMLATVKAGGAYVPLDPGYPASRLDYMLKDTGAPVLLTLTAMRASFPEYSGRIICLDELDGISSSESLLPVALGPDNLAYVMYTSGSTGEPKGVMVPQRAVKRLVLNTNYVQLQPSDVVGQVSNFSFDAATFEVWGALLNGASLAIIDRDIAISPREFADELARHRVSAMFLTSALFNVMAKEVPTAFTTVRTLIVGGEEVDPRSAKRVLDTAPPKRLLNGYGPTETTTFATFFEIADVEQDAATIPIGRPISNTSAYVLDEARNPVPIGVTGELYIGGEGVALGYLNQPELTARKFLRDPFADDEKSLLYATGDLVRRRADGNIEFLGRSDHQVKLRGFRIELGEVEAALARHEAVESVAVLLREDVPGEKSLVAHVCATQRKALHPEALRFWLKKRLPSYMVPSTFVVVDELPLTDNGKIDRKALSEITLSRARSDAGSVQPENETEQRISSIWRELLSLDSVGVLDNFFDLGGHSLLVTRVQMRIEDVFGIRLPVQRLYGAPTIRELARSVDELCAHTGVLERERGEL